MQLNQTIFCPISSVRTNTFSSTDVRFSKKKYRECLSRGRWWSWSLSWGFKFPYGSWGRWILKITRRSSWATTSEAQETKSNEFTTQKKIKSQREKEQKQKAETGLDRGKETKSFSGVSFSNSSIPALSLCGLHLSYISHLHTLSLPFSYLPL